jgi:L-fuculose-phosphate aldolase
MWESEKREIMEAARRMEEKGLVTGTAGNVSMRLKDPGGRHLLAITPSGRYYDSLDADDIVVVDFAGERVEGQLRASIETPMHVAVYQARPKVNAIMHSHPVSCSALAIAGLEIPPLIDEQITYLGGEIKVSPYALPGSKELAANVVAALGPRNGVIMANHGALCTGRDMREALAMSELLESTARIYISALSLGKANQLPADVVELEKAVFASIYGEGQT